MTARTHQVPTQTELAALANLDDASFWQTVATFGYDRPAAIDPDQAWFWTRTWVTKEIEADISIAEGRTTFYASGEEFLASLEEEDGSADADIRED